MAVKQDDFAKLSSLNKLVMEAYREGKFSEAISIAHESIALSEKVLGPDHPDTATALNNLATLYDSRGEHAKAEAYRQRALKITGLDHPATAQAANTPNIVSTALSPSVHAAMDGVGNVPVSAVAFVQAIFKLHKEYAGGAAESLRLTDTLTKRPAPQWVDDILALFDPAQMQVFSRSGKDVGPYEPTVHGTCCINQKRHRSENNF